DLVVQSDLPVGAGLSSSAALEVGAVAVLAELSGVRLSADDAALLAWRAENEFVGVPTGTMDQTVVACGKAGHALLLDTRAGDRRGRRLGSRGDGVDRHRPSRGSRVAPRRLRGVVRRARSRGDDSDGRGGDRRPHDGSGIRRVRDRAGVSGPGDGRRAGGGLRVRGSGSRSTADVHRPSVRGRAPAPNTLTPMLGAVDYPPEV